MLRYTTSAAVLAALIISTTATAQEFDAPQPVSGFQAGAKATDASSAANMQRVQYGNLQYGYYRQYGLFGDTGYYNGNGANGDLRGNDDDGGKGEANRSSDRANPAGPTFEVNPAFTPYYGGYGGNFGTNYGEYSGFSGYGAYTGFPGYSNYGGFSYRFSPY
ncbi:hypothetical protein [Lignipirellula cremea]|uniref:Uncharacterized protein n=1 Tax=Lignipirellula cremea TaxID=2528010 RepID=A0A518DUN6_9BACT|nr:hypothetical protein [Lignipirellula cremea]QDU95551.1 hypothetical protein Pla8534_33660 [Lignipirellula cremea]